MAISLHRGPVGDLEGVRLPGRFERKYKTYLCSFLGPRGHKVFSLGAIWNSSKDTGLS